MKPAVAVVLAAGRGTRMNSDLPKVLHPVCGRPMIEFVLDALQSAGINHSIVVVGYEADLVRQTLAHRSDVAFADQIEQLGTGHAVMMCRGALRDHEGPVLVVTGDSPLAQPNSISALLAAFYRDQPAAILGTLHCDDPAGLGRIVRDTNGEFQGIVEEKDASDRQKQITEVNMSTYVFDCHELLHALDQLDNQNQQQEYYITDCPGILKNEGKDVQALAVLKPCEGLSINTIEELASVSNEMRRMGYPCVN
ncbi:MAG TPA: NTP transferase domain-containing protein [Pirellulaceae bacterium]|nr:NTP transferase domain-containing protein [Pirellulaceae bacterium]